jgi:hypothetical protein
MEDGMNFKNFITCCQCMRELTPTLAHEKGEAMVSNYHCEQCCYSFSIYSITKTKLAEMQGTNHFIKEGDELLPMEQHEMEDK